MSQTTLPDASAFETEAHAAEGAAAGQHCEECVGSGGWYRYEPALDPAPGLLYLSCVQCRGSGWTATSRA